MNATTHAILAYGVSTLLLWGYAAKLWLSARRRRSSHTQSNPGIGSHQS